ncbi:alpha/beta hydrolase [Maribacter polysaccharolyticus]|uniref:alpha/beta hydrolase n=1 Tax=Maribacter polysaccharolyticus TaxID=3020831 RepID=UPI00237F2E03|nr:alpha/beta hydrolase [Maribacter polysaccharolyticus]MDE3741823.1 alpha/beta hydrolase [Maribacter polysaccharolyticus]
MKKIILFFLFCSAYAATAQQLTFGKGVVMDSVKVLDTISESFALYLPTKFEVTKPSPVVFIYDTEGRGANVVRMLMMAAEKNQFVLAASNNVRGDQPLSKNVLISKRMFQTVFDMFNIQKGRVYTAGFAEGARLASVMPTFFSQIKGVISCGAGIANSEVLSSNNPFHFIGIVGLKDYNYPDMLQKENVFNSLKFKNQTLVFDGGHEWPNQELLSEAMELFNIGAMVDRVIPLDTAFIEETYRGNLGRVNKLISENNPLFAYRKLEDIMKVYKPLIFVDSLKNSLKTLRRSSGYKAQKRNESSVFFKEALIKQDYDYALEEDIYTYNYNNLGWWKYQMEELRKYEKNPNIFMQHMGVRLRSYLEALIADHMDMIRSDSPVDEEALNFLWMLKTITAPEVYDNYLKVISINSKFEDFGTALFYLEELLKIGYDDVDRLYALEHTALLRITPEFNQLIDEYLKKARYDIIEE